MKSTSWLLLCLATLGPTATLGIGSSFDENMEGWTLVDVNGGSAEGVLVWQPEGGNPGGFLEFTDGGSDGGFVSAPASYLGDWADCDGTVTIMYDHRIISEGTVDERLPYEIRISGPGGVAQFLGDVPEGPSDWIPVTAPILESYWNVLSGTWTDILGEVTSFRIRIEQTDGHVDVSGVDNVDFPWPTAIPDDRAATLRIVGCEPNPFDAVTGIAFRNHSAESVRLDLFDLRGRRVVSRDYRVHLGEAVVVHLEGLDEGGRRLPAGPYVVRLVSGKHIASTTVTVVK